MATVLRRAKAKAAQRVIEVLDYFDEQHRQATVMDIARRYSRPQSSTSELLASLVDLGLLYKDPGSRSYSLTPRAAILGSLSQPRAVRDGRLSLLIDELRGQTGLGVALVGMIGPQAQVFRWKPGLQRLETTPDGGFGGGAQETLCDTAAGWLLLSTLPDQRREGMIRRLNAEAPDGAKFNHVEMSARVQDCGRRGVAIGPSGFGVAGRFVAVLLPGEPEQRPMTLAFVHEAGDKHDPAQLAAILQRAVQSCASTGEEPARLSMADAA